MKFTFATALIAAIASAQYEESYEEPEQTPEEKFEEVVEAMFEINEQGQFELNHPDLPVISFNDVDDAKIEAWATDVENTYRDNDLEWVDAWNSYQDAVAQPWNDFLDKVVTMGQERDQIDIATTKDIVNFVTENSFVDGQSLKEMFPDIDTWLVDMESEWTAESQAFSLDQIKVPVEMKRRNRKPVTARLMYSEYYYEDPYYYDDYEQSSEFEEAMEEVADKLGEAIISWGFEPEVVENWMNTKNVAWKDLIREQDKQSAEMAQKDIREASDYVKAILDNMVIDMEAKSVENREQFKAEVDSKVADLKSEIDRQAEENIANVRDWINSSYNDVVDMTEMTYEEMQAETISFAQADLEVAESTSYGYGLLAFGAAAATAAFLYKKKQQKSIAADEQKESLLDEDEEFQMV